MSTKMSLIALDMIKQLFLERNPSNQKVLSLLRSADPSERLTAVLLVRIENDFDTMLKVLPALFRDSDLRVAKEAIAGLGHWNDEKVEAELANLICSGYATDELKIAAASNIRDPSLLHRCFESNTAPEVLIAIIRSVEEWDSPDLARIAELLKYKSESTAYAIREYLRTKEEQIGDDREDIKEFVDVSGVKFTILNADDPKDKKALMAAALDMAKSLSSTYSNDGEEDDEAEDDLNSTEGEDCYARRDFASIYASHGLQEALGPLKQHDAKSEILSQLSSSDTYIRQVTVESLIWSKDLTVLPYLVNALFDSEAVIRECIIHDLGEFFEKDE